VEKLIALWYSMTIDQFVITALIVSNFAMWIRIQALSGKYHQLDKLILVHAWIINIKLGRMTVKQHRNGDYEIVEPMNGD
jgi:hypothetical protein